MDSGWPLSFLLDEVWLKTRRILTHKLESKGLWPKDQEYRNFVEGERKLGNEIKSEVLLSVLGQRDYGFLNSELSFGSNNAKLKKRIPYVVAFGYEISKIICELIAPKQICTVTKISSVFNFGISLFDYVCDSNPLLFSQFMNTMNRRVLLEITTDEEACKLRLHKCDMIDVTELRLLTKVVLWFFLELHRLHQRSSNTRVWKKLISCLLSAYTAEVASSAHTNLCQNQLQSVARDKSTLPFIIIYLTGALRSTKNNPLELNFLKFALGIGEIFWSIDDLRDILQDLQYNNLNSILLGIDRNPYSDEDIVRKYDILKLLLSSNRIESHVDGLCFKTKSVLDFIDSHSYQKKSEYAKRIITCYIRNWME
jgi:hypothetical protein